MLACEKRMVALAAGSRVAVRAIRLNEVCMNGISVGSVLGLN